MPALAQSPRANVTLSIMMLLQFFIWGAWYVPTSGYMSTLKLEFSIGWIYTVGPIAAIISPLILGMIADRYFSAEKVLGVLHLLGGGIMLLAPFVGEQVAAAWAAETAGMTAEQITDTFGAQFLIWVHAPFVGLIFLHMLCYMPTLGLTNTIAFRNLTNQEKQFPIIRVFGTIGWILAGLSVDFAPKMLSSIGINTTSAFPLQLAGIAAILLGIFSFVGLPKTPPIRSEKKATVGEMLGLDALAMCKDRSFLIFAACSMLICIPLAAYYSYAYLFVDNAGFRAPAATMSFGQVSEILFMILMPLFFVRLGVKWMLLVGMLAWVLRYALFALGASDGVVWMILMGVVLHGICYDFFFVTGFIYTDKRAPQAIRGQAQGFLVLLTQGIGLGLGAQIIQRVVNANKSANYDELAAQAGALRAQAAEATDSELAATLWNQASDLLLQSYNWQNIWLVPCIFAAVVAVIFFIFFREQSRGMEQT